MNRVFLLQSILFVLASLLWSGQAGGALPGDPSLETALATASSERADDCGTFSVDLEGVGLLRARPMQSGEPGTMLVLAKPGGQSEILTTLEGFQVHHFFQADLDGDHTPEIVLLATNAQSQEMLPFIFGTQGGIHRLHPPTLGEYPVSGESITLISIASGAALCVKVPYRIHEFGPPDLLNKECYRIRNGELVKTGSQTETPGHFNQMANWAGQAFQEGDFLSALSRYEKALGMKGPDTLPTHLAEVRFFLAECRKHLKDFSSAIQDYQNVVLMCPDGEFTEQAQRECEFLSKNLQDRAALPLYVDAVSLISRGKYEEALQLLDLHLERTMDSSMRDHLLFQKGEAILALGRLDEAMQVFRALLQEFPDSPVRPEVEDRLQELEGDPDESDGL